MRPRSLASLLTRQWMLFAIGMAVVFAAAALLLLFLLEDSFIDRRLQAAGRSVTAAAPGPASLPPEFAVFAFDEAPLDIHAKLPFASAGKPFEMRRADRRHVHVLVTGSGVNKRVIVYDATDQLTVTPRLGIGLLLSTVLAGTALLVAYALARTFVGRVARHAEKLAGDVRDSLNPGQLRDLAARQPVLEFQKLLQLHAELWESKLQAMENERQTLAYLGHELRTPLQSAQTSLALLTDERNDPGAFDRLGRAIARLVRASRAAVWLATERQPDLAASAPVLPVLRALVAELEPIAKVAGQDIEVDISREKRFGGPPEIAEAILGNLLLNAIQHGAPGRVSIEDATDGLTLTNRCLPGEAPSGFGFGLEIVQRLARRIGWTITVERDDDSMRAVVRFASRVPTAQQAGSRAGETQ